ncbi:MAG: ornithine carbamoyltransferase [Phycisphaerales bacterium]
MAQASRSFKLAGGTKREGVESLHAADVLTGAELSRADLEMALGTAGRFKGSPGPFASALAGKTMVMLFEKASLRTRVTFEVGAYRLGAQAIYLDHQQTKIGQRESIRDYGKNLERWAHCIVARTDSHGTVEALAREAGIPVINALSDTSHPCQALADMLTLKERFGKLEGLRLAYVGDGNNVCASLMLLGARLGVKVTVVTPAGAEPREEAVRMARAGAEGKGSVELTNDVGAVAGAHAVYTDTWTSMGSSTSAERDAAFGPYQVNAELMRKAGPEAVFMHCLPAHRGVEVTDEVIDSPASLVYEQAENRLHAQAGLMLHLMAGQGRGPSLVD